MLLSFFFFFSSRRRHTRCSRDWSSDVCSSDLSDRPIPAGRSDGSSPSSSPRPRLAHRPRPPSRSRQPDRKSTRLNSSHGYISYAVFCLKKKKKKNTNCITTTHFAQDTYDRVET